MDGDQSIAWDKETINRFDAVVIATAHKAVNYQELADWAPCIVDTRNAMRDFENNGRSGLESVTMSAYETLTSELVASPKTWLVTGVGGFIGSNLLEALLKLDQRVIGLDNFSTGHQKNLAQVEKLVEAGKWKNFKFIDGDIATWRSATARATGWIMSSIRPRSVPCPNRLQIRSRATIAT